MENKKEIIKMLNEYLPKLCTGIEDVAQEYYKGQENQNEKMIIIIDGLNWVINAMEILKSELLNNKDFIKINESLEEMLQAMSVKDTILIADVMRYEIIPILEQWRVLCINSDIRYM